MYEIEHRALLTEDQYHQLSERLRTDAELLGQDDKDVAYYIFPDKLLKVVKNISKNTGVLSLKLNTLGNGSSFQEVEAPFSPESYDAMRHICDEISTPSQVIVGTQKRTNFMYEGVEIALKWSEDWSYHVELEVMIDDLSKKDAADQQIRSVADSLSISLMTEEEVAAFTAKVRANRQ